MPRVHFVKAARKVNPVARVGESYYWWKFRYGGKHYSKTPPRPSQLTQSEYYGIIRATCEALEDYKPEQTTTIVEARSTLEAAAAFIREQAEQVQQAGEECQDKLDNMPEGLQEGDTGQLLQERIEACDSAYTDMDNVADELESEDPEQWRADKDEDEDDVLPDIDDDFPVEEDDVHQFIQDKIEEAIQYCGDAEI